MATLTNIIKNLATLTNASITRTPVPTGTYYGFGAFTYSGGQLVGKNVILTDATKH